jgi:hypothetical protein
MASSLFAFHRFEYRPERDAEFIGRAYFDVTSGVDVGEHTHHFRMLDTDFADCGPHAVARSFD